MIEEKNIIDNIDDIEENFDSDLPIEEDPKINQNTEDSRSNLNLIMNVPLRLSVEVGRTKMTIKDILTLTKGDVVELDKLEGDPADILVNGKMIAKGNIIVVDEKFGVKISEILKNEEILKKL